MHRFTKESAIQFSLIILLLLGSRVLFAQLTESHLPIVVITAPTEIPDEPKVEAFMGIINNPDGMNHINDPFDHFQGAIGIEIRGQSSLWFPKKQYGIEIRDIEGNDLDTSILDLPSESDFVLSAPFSDKSLMRNPLSYILAGQIMDYAPRVRYCELVLNGTYQGVYILTEKIKRSASRLDLSKLKPEDISGEELEGGYIVRFDKYDQDDEVLWTSPIDPYPSAWQKAQFVAAYPKFDEIQEEQKDYIEAYITVFEQALHHPTFQYQGTHYSEYIDVNSFVDFMIMNELTRNVDGYRISSYMHKDKNGLLEMGPVWDFNLGFGNADYCEGGQVEGWQWDFNTICGNDFFSNHFWWKRFLEDPNFKQALGDRWISLRASTFSNEKICYIIDSLQLRIGEAADRNFETWPVLGTYIWPNQFIGDTYQEEVDYLKSWIEDRLEFMDQELELFTQVSSDNIYANIHPNPNGGFFRIETNQFNNGPYHIEIFDVTGVKVYERKAILDHALQLDLSLSSGAYYVKIYTDRNDFSPLIKSIVIY